MSVRPMLALVSIPLEGNVSDESRSHGELTQRNLESIEDGWNYDDFAVNTTWELSLPTAMLQDPNDLTGTTYISGQFMQTSDDYIIAFFRGALNDAGDLTQYTCGMTPRVRPMLALVSIPFEDASPKTPPPTEENPVSGVGALALGLGWNYDDQAINHNPLGAFNFTSGAMTDPNTGETILGQYLQVTATKRIIAFLRGTPNNAGDLRTLLCR